MIPQAGENGGKSLVRETAEWLAREIKPGPVSPGNMIRETLADHLEQELRVCVSDVDALRAELAALPVSDEDGASHRAPNGVAIGTWRGLAVRAILLRHQADELLRRLRVFVENNGHPFALHELCEDDTLALFVESTIGLTGHGEETLSWWPAGLLVELRQLGLLPTPGVWRLRNLIEFAGRTREWTERLEAGVPRGGSHSMASQVSRMRRMIREGKIDPRLVALLKSLSFPIAPIGGVKLRSPQANIRLQQARARRGESSWEKTLERVQKRAKAQGHYRFASKSKNGIWLRLQLRLYRHGKLSAARVALLKKAGIPLTTRPRGRPARDAAPWGDIRGKRLAGRALLA